MKDTTIAVDLAKSAFQVAVLAILRAAIRWGQAQTPPLIDKSPFHRFGVRLNTKAETVRDRRISREEEKRLLDAALSMRIRGSTSTSGP
jgi:hypothetical protein